MIYLPPDKKVKSPLSKYQPGMRFGKLVLLYKIYQPTKAKGSVSHAVCLCDCGVVKKIITTTLGANQNKSCGCASRADNAAAHKTHGHHGTSNYRRWRAMISRCSNPNVPEYKDYGGRGISVCERWMKYENFLADMGVPEPGMTIDRWPNNNGNYEPGNCRWATKKEQSRNTRKTRFIEIDGSRMAMVDAAARYSISESTLKFRLDKGWSAERACTTPVRGGQKQRAGSRASQGL